MQRITNLIPLVVKAGADVNILTDEGTPLQMLCDNLRMSCFDLEDNGHLVFLFAQNGARYGLDGNAAKHSQLITLCKNKKILMKRARFKIMKVLCLLYAIGEHFEICDVLHKNVLYYGDQVKLAFEEVLLENCENVHCELVMQSG